MKGWTNVQKQLAVRAATAARIDEEYRKLILRQFPNANYKGRITSTSPKLTDADFEQFMAITERGSGDQIKIGGPRGQGFSKKYWQNKAKDSLHRMRYAARRDASILELTRADGRPLLEPGGKGLAGWIETRVTAGRTNKLDDLSFEELHALIIGLRKYGERHGVVWTPEPKRSA